MCELARTFFIKAVNDKHTICNVVLPNDLMIERKPLAECNEEDIHEQIVGTINVLYKLHEDPLGPQW